MRIIKKFVSRNLSKIVTTLKMNMAKAEYPFYKNQIEQKRKLKGKGSYFNNNL